MMERPARARGVNSEEEVTHDVSLISYGRPINQFVNDALAGRVRDVAVLSGSMVVLFDALSSCFPWSPPHMYSTGRSVVAIDSSLGATRSVRERL